MKWLSDLLTVLGLLLKLVFQLLVLVVSVALFALCVWIVARAV